MNFRRFAETLEEMSKTPKRSLKKSLAADFLKELDIEDVALTADFLSGRIFPESDTRSLNISWRGVMKAIGLLMDVKGKDIMKHYRGDVGVALAALIDSKEHSVQTSLFQEPLTITSVGSSFEKMAEASGKGSSREKEGLLVGLLSDASSIEVRYLTSLILGDLRTGLSEGLLLEAIAQAFGVSEDLARRAWSFSGNLGEVARLSAAEGEKGLAAVSIELFRPVKPMLATPAESVKEVMEEGGDEFAFELKLDGARVQIHKYGNEVRIFSRRLNDVTESLPEIAQIVVDEIDLQECVLDGEVVAINEVGTPYPFQVVMRRFGRTRDVDEMAEKVSLSLSLFDILVQDGKTTADEPYSARRNLLSENVPHRLLVENLVTRSQEAANKFFEHSKGLGHEGVVAKKVSSAYVPGVRGKLWFKIKHVLDTLDLVIVAAEWGHGRRSNWLSDYHLAVRNEESGEFEIVGKTFKGFTDEEFKQMTERLQRIKTSESRGVVRVKPEIVVEVVASEIQKSSTYKSGLALRFARITSIRNDKTPEDAMTLSDLEKMFDRQFKYKAR